jgi:hypothetical protein
MERAQCHADSDSYRLNPRHHPRIIFFVSTKLQMAQAGNHLGSWRPCAWVAGIHWCFSFGRLSSGPVIMDVVTTLPGWPALKLSKSFASVGFSPAAARPFRSRTGLPLSSSGSFFRSTTVISTDLFNQGRSVSTFCVRAAMKDPKTRMSSRSATVA